MSLTFLKYLNNVPWCKVTGIQMKNECIFFCSYFIFTLYLCKSLAFVNQSGVGGTPWVPNEFDKNVIIIISWKRDHLMLSVDSCDRPVIFYFYLEKRPPGRVLVFLYENLDLHPGPATFLCFKDLFFLW